MPDLADRARTLLELHSAPEILVLTNVWDVVSARVVAATEGAHALATASHSIAATFGYEDGENIPLDLHRAGRADRRRGRPPGDHGHGGRLRRRGGDHPPGDRGRRRRREPRGPDEAPRRRGGGGRGGAAGRPRRGGIDFVLNARTDAFVRARATRTAPSWSRRRSVAGRPTSRPVHRWCSSRARWPATRSRRWSRGWAPGGSASSPCRGVALGARLEELGVARVSTGPFTQRVALTALQDAITDLVAGGSCPPAPAR